MTALLFVAGATTVSAEVLFVSTGGFIVENKVVTRASPDEAWRALVDDVGKWWPADHTWYGKSENLTIEPLAGGCFCERDGGKSAQHMRIAVAEPGALLRMTGGLGPLQGMGMHGALDWVIAPAQGGTLITLTYRVSGINKDGFEQLAPVVDRVQAQQLGGLGAFLGAPEER